MQGELYISKGSVGLYKRVEIGEKRVEMSHNRVNSGGLPAISIKFQPYRKPLDTEITPI
jgi:hypothetical protein